MMARGHARSSGTRISATTPRGSCVRSASWASRPYSAARRARVLASPMPVPLGLRHAEADARVGDGDDELPPVEPRRDVDPPGVGRRRESVLDRILGEREQHHRRKRIVAQRGWHVDREREVLAHADLQHVEIGADEIGLLPERRRTAAQLRQRGAQVADDVVEHGDAARHVALAQPLDVGERVEQEVRLDLRAHHLQPRLEHLPVERDALERRFVHPAGRGRGPSLHEVDGRHHRAGGGPAQRVACEAKRSHVVDAQVLHDHVDDAARDGAGEDGDSHEHRTNDCRHPWKQGFGRGQCEQDHDAVAQRLHIQIKESARQRGERPVFVDLGLRQHLGRHHRTKSGDEREPPAESPQGRQDGSCGQGERGRSA